MGAAGFVSSKGRFQPVNHVLGIRALNDKPTKAKTPARWQGFFQFKMVARGGIDQGLRMFNPSSM
jgi:hypothetical protein